MFVSIEVIHGDGLVRSSSLDVVTAVSDLLSRLDPDPLRQGRQFEHICKWFLTTDPVYSRDLRHVWLWKEWPDRWGADAGIDLVAEDHRGHLWAIQAKAYDEATWITKRDVDTFLAESGRPELSRARKDRRTQEGPR